MNRSKTVSIFRYIGNLLLVVGYFLLLHVNLKLGLIVNLIGGFLTLPYMVQNKLWDLVGICIFFTVIEFAKLFTV